MFMIVSLVLFASAIVTATSPAVTLDYGTFQGSLNGSVELFLGIPYAQPPVGDLRFRRPRPPLLFTKTQDATVFGNACLQQSFTFPSIPSLNLSILRTFASSATQSEDCLNLNVFRPAIVHKNVKLPVVVWFYGGAFMTGDASSYNASTLVSRSVELGQPVIYVSVNYRVNAFGFLAGREVKDAGVANLGIHDQTLALHWVQSHIMSFGGDPRKVTLWGQSSGGVSVTTQMVLNAKSTKTPFRAAIVHSAFTPLMGLTADAKNQNYYGYLVENTNCSYAVSTLDCLRQVPTQSLLDVINTTPGMFTPHGFNLTWSLTVDGVLLNKTLKQYISDGHYVKVPVLGGQVDDEGTLFSLYSQNITTNDEFISFIADEYFPNASYSALDHLASAYSENPALGSPFDTGNQSVLTPEFKRVSAFHGDFYFQAGRRETFSFYKSTQEIWSFCRSLSAILSVSINIQGFIRINPMAQSMQATSFLVNFINNLDPNHPRGSATKSGLSSVYWPSYNKADKMLLFSDNATEAYTTITDNYRQAGIQAAIEIETEFHQ